MATAGLLTSAHADTCDDLIAKVARMSGATLERSQSPGAPWYSFAHREASRITVTCYGAETPATAEIMLEGPEPPDAFFVLAGDIGAALTTAESQTLRTDAKACSVKTSKTHDLVKATDVDPPPLKWSIPMYKSGRRTTACRRRDTSLKRS